MIGMVVLSFSALSGQTGSDVRIVPTREIPVAPLTRLTPSSNREREGIVLLQEQGFSNEILKKLQKALEGYTVKCVVRKLSSTSFATYPNLDLKAFRKEHAKTSHTISIFDGQGQDDVASNEPNKDVFDEMIEGDVVAIMKSDYEGYSFGMIHFGPLGPRGSDYASKIIQLGTPQPGYANIPFQITWQDNMGLLWPDTGSQVSVDGIRFTVTGQSKVSLEAVHPFRAHIRQEGVAGSSTYEFESKWSNGDTIEESRREYEKDLKAFKPSPQHEATSSSGIKNFIVDCGQPFKFWKGIEIHRMNRVSGYYSHVKIP